MNSGVYKITVDGSDKVYIGQSSDLNKRMIQHRCDLRAGKSSKFLQNAYNKYGGQHRFKVLFYCEEADLNEMEIRAIRAYDSYRPSGYNLTEGGEGTRGFKMSEANKEKLRKRNFSSGYAKRVRVARSTALTRKLGRDIPTVESENRERIKAILPTIGQAQLQLAEIVSQIQAIEDTGYGAITAEKNALREELKRLIERLSSIKHQIHFTPVRVALNRARDAIRYSGQTSETLDYLNQVRERLSGELNCTWKHIVVTIVNHGQGLQAEAMRALCDALPRFHRSFFKRPCYTIRGNKGIGDKGNASAHLLYYGPDIEHAQLKEHWLKFATDANRLSDAVWIEQAYNDDQGDLDDSKAVFEAFKQEEERMIEANFSPDMGCWT